MIATTRFAFAGMVCRDVAARGADWAADRSDRLQAPRPAPDRRSAAPIPAPAERVPEDCVEEYERWDGMA